MAENFVTYMLRCADGSYSVGHTEAPAVELRIKNWSRAKKEALAGGNFEGLSLAAKKKDWRSDHRRRERSS
jgi:predicted GIY-YIG superfamily endonuclease